MLMKHRVRTDEFFSRLSVLFATVHSAPLQTLPSPNLKKILYLPERL